MRYSIDRVAVIGAGVMGSALAAHMANGGIKTILLDIVPPEGSGVAGDPTSRVYRDAFAVNGLKSALKSRPNAFYRASSSRLIRAGNLDDDLELLRDADWVLEAVVERMDVKRALFSRIAPYIKDDAILSSNTSGLSLNEMAGELDTSLRERFIGTHFFNPPRYMRLLEIIPSRHTSRAVIDFISRFGERRLGKGVVYAKDTPSFIANRIGVFSMMSVIHAMIDGGYTVEEVDRLTGPAIGRPKSASFRTADLVGLDTFLHVAKNVYDRSEHDERRDSFLVPPFMQKMLERGMLGRKSGQGFYKKEGKSGSSEILALDYETLAYREQRKVSFPSLDLARSMDDPGERVLSILRGKDRAGQFLWRTISETLIYAANRLGEITDDIISIDNAMKWGFNWEMGPFELWDAIGVEQLAERMAKEGKNIPSAVERLLQTGSRRFYFTGENCTRYYFDIGGGHEEKKSAEDSIELQLLKCMNRVVQENAAASLIDMGDGVLGLEFHSKMNAIGADTIRMINKGVELAEQDFEALVIANEGKNFSVGANLMLLLLESQDGNWEEIDLIVRAFQKANMALKYCRRPVVAAPFGMTLGGGCEVALGAGHMYTAAETYMGLVEVSVGLIPGGGGTKELLLRHLEGMPSQDGPDVFPYARAAFETIGMAKVSMSAEEARDLKFLRQSDCVSINPARHLYSAKAMALGLARQGYRPPDPTVDLPVAGESGLAAVKSHLYNLREGGFISEYDRYLGGELAGVICGGALPAGTRVSEQFMLDLEREVFLRLCGQRKTQERMQHMLKTGKPLRN